MHVYNHCVRRLGVVLLLLAAVQPAAAQQLPALRIGYTDHEILISNMPESQQIQQTLQDEFERSQAALQALADDFQNRLERYQTQQALLSEERRSERERDLQAAQEDLQQKAQEAERDMQRLELELLGPLYERVDAAIQKISVEKGLDLVLRIQAGVTQPIILYANEDRIVDITLDVAIELGIDVSGATDANSSGN